MSLDKGWLDERYMHAKRSNLIAQSLSQSLKGKFAGSIYTNIWGCNMADHRAHVDDMPATLFAHHRQYSFNHADDSEQVGIELILYISKTGLLNCTYQGIASVVDQDINPPRLLKQRLDSCLNGRVRANIQGQP